MSTTDLARRAKAHFFRGKEILKPLQTGWIDERVACVREGATNVFFYVGGATPIMIDAGCDYGRLQEKMGWLDLDVSDVGHVLITHHDPDHMGSVYRASTGLLKEACVYLSREEMRYLTGDLRRHSAWGLWRQPQAFCDNRKHLLADGDVVEISGVRVEAIATPGHTLGHLSYLVDDAYLFCGDALWLGPDGGYGFCDVLAEDAALSLSSLAHLEQLLRERGLSPRIITSHSGWSDDLDFVFAHRDESCHALFCQTPHDENAPFDPYLETDTEDEARQTRLEAASTVVVRADPTFWDRAAFTYDLTTSGGREGITEAAAYVCDHVGTCDVVLDAACGTGAFTVDLARAAGYVAGIDLSRNMVRRARTKAWRADLANVDFAVGDICALDFADDTFDVCVAANVLPLLQDPAAAIRELVRVTRPDGLLALPTYVSAPGRKRHLETSLGVSGHVLVHHWDEEAYLAFLSSCGLTLKGHRTIEATCPLCVALCSPS